MVSLLPCRGIFYAIDRKKVFVVAELRSKKQEEFVQKVVGGMPQRQAFRSVYKNNMTDAQVDAEASAMLNGTGKYAKNPKIHQRYLELNSAAQEEAEDKTIADAQEVMRYLTSVLRGESQSEIVVIENTGDFSSRARAMQKAPDETQRLKAAELLGKRYGLYKENVDVNGAIPVVISGADDLED